MSTENLCGYGLSSASARPPSSKRASIEETIFDRFSKYFHGSAGSSSAFFFFFFWGSAAALAAFASSLASFFSYLATILARFFLSDLDSGLPSASAVSAAAARAFARSASACAMADMACVCVCVWRECAVGVEN